MVSQVSSPPSSAATHGACTAIGRKEDDVTDNRLVALEGLGQSVWMDFIRRSTVISGQLARWIAEDALRGMTSNPTIFEKAIVESHDYDDQIRALAETGKSAPQIFEALAVRDIQLAADAFRPIYDRLDGRDGFVSLEVSPHLAHDSAATIQEAKRLWSEVDRPNVMIKVPATIEGLPAIERLIGDGINVNITLLFGLPRYQKVIEAYLAGLEARAAAGQPLRHIASVASFFLSRIDVLLDPQLDEIAGRGGELATIARRLRGEIAVASAKTAYQIYKQAFGAERFRRLAHDGARVQRLLWASTSTKDPTYSDVKYVDALIGRSTIETVPLDTFEAYRDHGDPAPTLEDDVEDARQKLHELVAVGIDLDRTTHRLEDEGVAKFSRSYDQLIEALEQRRKAASPPQRASG
jgi:transaldolase